MVDDSAASIDRAFRALGSAPRREILRRTAAQPCSVTQLAAHFDMSLAAVSKHVRVLADAGLLTSSREGRIHWCRFEVGALTQVRASIDQLATFWEKRLDALEQVLVSDTAARRGRKKR
ncbi:MAG: metalloregulator ArsR/SmtB family transcription factor [Archangium sp.]|nr:metalloregulator ArsR/SmtB family transcription factor [Archangium sp.]MDP3153720.1 metalloregulator ArsR/SmtB family transcription factor [Archangium sp.]MDP3569231.1 metalloregulator ArsR/SmtB family transcription factor [Archangium sp.]